MPNDQRQDGADLDGAELLREIEIVLCDQLDASPAVASSIARVLMEKLKQQRERARFNAPDSEE